ncbi:MAG: CPBP family intramembrane metalloprotease [Planctomycetes bacterium]|nr:CPBP family intramembrane metalloprotease [Planctomycetota bacterium]
MRFGRRVRSIYRKELVDILRDRRTLVAMVVVPIVLYPLLMVVFANAAGGQTSEIEQEQVIFGTKSFGDQQRLIQLIRQDDAALRVEQGLAPVRLDVLVQDQPQSDDSLLSSAFYEPAEDLQGLIRDRIIHVGVEFTADEATFTTEPRVRVRVYVLDELIRSRLAANRFRALLERMNERARPDLFVITEVRLTTPSSILSLILPLILVLMTITGAIYPAIDLTAGERERGTLESLLVCPVPVFDLVVGKFLVVTTVAMVGAALNLASVSATVYFGGFTELISPPAQYAATESGSANGLVIWPDGQQETAGFPWMAIPLILVALVPFAVLMSAIMMAVCAFARTFKEAQNYVTPVILAVLVPGGAAALPGTQLQGGMLVMPVANMVLLTRDLLRGPSAVPLSSIAWVLLSTSLFAVAAVAIAAKVFATEAVVFSDSGSLRLSLTRRLMRRTARPSVAMATLIVAILLPVWFYVQSSLASGGQIDAASLLKWTAGLMPLLFVLVPGAILYYWKVNLRSALSLGRPPVRCLVGALLIGLGAWAPAHALVVYQVGLFGIPAGLDRFTETMREGISAMSPAGALFMIAVVPPVCEELLFRGLLLSGLRGSCRKWSAILLTAMVFAAFHMFFFRFPVTFAMGIVFGYLCWQSRSVWPAIVAHALHNGMGLSHELWPQVPAALGIDQSSPWGHLPLPLTIAGVLACAVGLRLNREPNRNPSSAATFAVGERPPTEHHTPA